MPNLDWVEPELMKQNQQLIVRMKKDWHSPSILLKCWHLQALQLVEMAAQKKTKTEGIPMLEPDNHGVTIIDDLESQGDL